MLVEIVTHTPLWVWGLLALLVARGLVMARPREARPGTFIVMPAILLAFGLQGLIARYDPSGQVLGAWLGAFCLGVLLAWPSLAPSSVRRTEGRIAVAGSFVPLVLILGIFLVRYVSEVALAKNPDLARLDWFGPAMAAASGIASGAFAGRAARILWLAREPRLVSQAI